MPETKNSVIANLQETKWNNTLFLALPLPNLHHHCVHVFSCLLAASEPKMGTPMQ